MKYFKSILFFLMFVLFFTGTLFSQHSLAFHGGVKFLEYRGSNIQLYYRDESPDPDDFYSDVDVSSKMIYNIGANYNNYQKKSSVYYDATANFYFGKFLGLEGGFSVGYPLFLTKNKKVSFLPSIMVGGGWYEKHLGTLINNTVYIEVNDVRFKDYTNVDLSLIGFYGLIRPTATLVFELDEQVQLRLSGSYMANLDFNPEVKFSGKDNNDNDVTAKEELNASNIAFYIDGNRTNDTPFKLMGFEARVGLSFYLDKPAKSKKK